jgi:hypothetical protein
MSPRRFFAGLSTIAALALSASASAQSKAPHQRLEEFIQLNQFASPYRGAATIDRWCYYPHIDKGDSWWYVENPTAGLDAIQVWNGFGIPLVSGAYGRGGALVVGYFVDRTTPAPDLDPVPPFSPNLKDCATGARILLDGPFPIVGLAKDIGARAAIDPAHEYRMWRMKGTYHRVRWISLIPVAYQVGNNQIAGSIVLGFTGDW